MSDDWYKRDVRAAIKGMIHLTLEERGAYNTLIDHMYLLDGSLHDDDTYIAGIMGCDIRVWRRLKKSLMSKERIVICDGAIADLRASYTIATRQLARSKRIASGQLGGIASGEVRKNNGLDEAHASTSFKQSREDKSREDKKDAQARAVVNLQTEFKNEFWPMYPHKVGKADALKAYLGARRKTEKQEIFDGLKRYIAAKPHDRPWCNPGTFLRQERWTDEPENITARKISADDDMERMRALL